MQGVFDEHKGCTPDDDDRQQKEVGDGGVGEAAGHLSVHRRLTTGAVSRDLAELWLRVLMQLELDHLHSPFVLRKVFQNKDLGLDLYGKVFTLKGLYCKVFITGGLCAVSSS